MLIMPPKIIRFFESKEMKVYLVQKHAEIVEVSLRMNGIYIPYIYA